MKPKHQRLIIVIVSILLIAAAVAIILRNFNDNLLFFYTPSQFFEKNIANDMVVRVGGLVEDGSVNKIPEQLITEFVITDYEQSMKIRYKGVVPGLFREGQGMIAKGSYDGNYFDANELLAKHDENYMPHEIADSMNLDYR